MGTSQAGCAKMRQLVLGAALLAVATANPTKIVFTPSKAGQAGRCEDVSQIHIALAKPNNTYTYSYSISWATQCASASELYVGSGMFEEHMINNDTKIIGTSQQYTREDPVFGSYTSPYLHVATVDLLLPTTTYWYVVGDASVGTAPSKALSSPYYFTTPNQVGDTFSPMVIGLTADLGYTNDSQKTMEMLANNPEIQVVFFAADLSYADCNQTKWDEFGVFLEQGAATVPFMFAAGNHENEEDLYNGLSFTAFENRFNMPRIKEAVRAPDPLYFNSSRRRILQETPVERNSLRGLTATAKYGVPTNASCTPSSWNGIYDYGNSFYSFDVGMVHAVYLNPYTNTSKGSPQYNFLAEDLAAVDRQLTPWVILVSHGPQYTTNIVHLNDSSTVNQLKNFEDLYYENKVAIILAGHVHDYERTYPVYKGNVTEGAPVYIQVGDGGNAEGHYPNYIEDIPAWSAYRNGTRFGSARLTIQSPQTAFFEWLPNFDGGSFQEDTAIITNPYAPSY